VIEFVSAPGGNGAILAHYQLGYSAAGSRVTLAAGPGGRLGRRGPCLPACSPLSQKGRVPLGAQYLAAGGHRFGGDRHKGDDAGLFAVRPRAPSSAMLLCVRSIAYFAEAINGYEFADATCRGLPGERTSRCAMAMAGCATIRCGATPALLRRGIARVPRSRLAPLARNGPCRRSGRNLDAPQQLLRRDPCPLLQRGAAGAIGATPVSLRPADRLAVPTNRRGLQVHTLTQTGTLGSYHCSLFQEMCLRPAAKEAICVRQILVAPPSPMYSLADQNTSRPSSDRSSTVVL
jgi:hypothetical protein